MSERAQPEVTLHGDTSQITENEKVAIGIVSELIKMHLPDTKALMASLFESISIQTLILKGLVPETELDDLSKDLTEIANSNKKIEVEVINTCQKSVLH